MCLVLGNHQKLFWFKELSRDLELENFTKRTPILVLEQQLELHSRDPKLETHIDVDGHFEDFSEYHSEH